MSGAIRVLLPPSAVELAHRVLAAGCTPVIDATDGEIPDLPAGAWVRILPGHHAPGDGPVVLAEYGAPLNGRETWLESASAQDIPAGFAGVILKGREAGGAGADKDGLSALADCPDPSKIILDAGCGPVTAGAAAALGACGVIVHEALFALPELRASNAMLQRMQLPDDEITTVVNGFRVAAGPTAPVLRKLVEGADVWSLQQLDIPDRDPSQHLWVAGQGLALAIGLAERHPSLEALLSAYVDAWNHWPKRAHASTKAENGPLADTLSSLDNPNAVATTGGLVGSAVLWEQAHWLGKAVLGEPAKGAMATGLGVVAESDALDDVRAELPPVPVASPSPALPTAVSPAASAPPPTTPATEAAPAVAIIGIGCRFPGGGNGAEGFWNNIVGKVDAITDIPTERWDPALFFDADPATPDKTYTKIGGFLTDFKFESKKFRIPPAVARQIDLVQQMTLVGVAEALQDAGLKVDARSDGREFDRERCAVILGNSLGGELSDAYAIRLAWPEVVEKLSKTEPFVSMSPDERSAAFSAMEGDYKAGLPIVDEDSMPGELANVIAGRIANSFNLGGANFTVDAACASSMAAIQTAVKSLQDGDNDIVVTGAADRSMNIATYVKFCKIGALSPDHSAPFDASANGFVMGEGCGIMVLKRLEDAQRDGDRIYAVIRGVGASSDGKGKGITAPNIQGQIRSLTRAYSSAGIEPWDVDLIEAHGTSTVVGDKVEIEALSEVIGSGKRDGRGPIRVGSVKSMIGHLKSAAGAASVIKAALALHKGILPPSLNFKTARPDVPYDTVPLKVQTDPEPWPETPDGLRRAGVSAFGFGGTNFHVVLESWAGQSLPRSVMQTAPEPQRVDAAASVAAAPPKPSVSAGSESAPAQQGHGLPNNIWAVSGIDEAELADNLKRLIAGESVPFHPSAPHRIAAAALTNEQRVDQLERTLQAVKKGSNPDLLRARGISREDGAFDGKLALLFTGQGSQYVDMGLDLADTFPIVRETFDEADAILKPTLGKGITDFIRLAPGEDADEKADVLRRTEYSQPATLALDVAILRMLAAHGVFPDMVAGHSLGEYGAAVAAGVMTFEQALLAVSARGREMAGIRLDDPGKMAGIAASTADVEAVLAEVDGYVIPANKNCSSQTVIAGASEAVEEACERFKARGVTVYPLPVSHAFHSAIVEPASEPLRGVLTKLGLQAPRRPITTNVTGDYYPSGDDSVPQIIDLLAKQISAPVEWTAQMERMYADGARAFVECGPKRALAGFTVSILKRRPHRSLYTNHPKRGGVTSFLDGLASLVALGMPVREAPTALANIDLFEQPEPRRSTTRAIEAFTELHGVQTDVSPDVAQGILRIVANATGYAPEDLDPTYELEADLGIDTVKQAEVFSVVRSTYGIPSDPHFRFTDHKTLESLIRWAGERTGAQQIRVEHARPAPQTPAPAPARRVSPPPPPATSDAVAAFLTRAAESGLKGLDADAFANALMPAVQTLLQTAFEAGQSAQKAQQTDSAAPAPAPTPTVPAAAPAPAQTTTRLPGQPHPIRPDVSVVCSGASIGLPGGDEVFDPRNTSAMLAGDNRISHVGDRSNRFLDMGIVRLVKDPQTGQGSFLPVNEVDQVIRLAGTKSAFSLSDWGVDERLQEALDITTQLAFAAGLEAMRDAGIPLVRSYRKTSSGKKVPMGWALPESMRDDTGIIFGSAFPGFDQLTRHLLNGGKDAEGQFDRRFLFQVLTMGHSQFAQFIGARGPNAALNAACASSTQGLSVAEDWIRMGRCERVIVVGSDDVTNETLLPWIGGGFMAAGAASTKDVIEEAALPFDARRHGLILGMGAVGVVVETEASARARGVTPIAQQLGTTIVNSAFHGTRLDVNHIASAMKQLIDDVLEAEGISVEAFAKQAMFMSHETYTPARGGSAAAEIEALRYALGDAARDIVIVNTKGVTGHPMGAGIEDGVALKALQYDIVPPVANLKEPDETLGELTLSQGERRPFAYAIRLAAGFGSQLALTVHRAVAKGDDRVDLQTRAGWLREVTGFAHAAESIDQRTLRVAEADEDRPFDLRPDSSPIDDLGLDVSAPAPSSGTEPSSTNLVPGDSSKVLAELIAVVAEKTGYDSEEIEADFELEADLGIDTVKQAEIIGDLTDRYGLERDENFRISDYPTIQSLADYLASQGSQGDALPPESSVPNAPPESPSEPSAPAATHAETTSSALEDLLAVVAEKTGYDIDELEPDFELEADLGIDTVKQAEILGELTERYGIPQDDEFRLADYPTIEALAGYLSSRTLAQPSNGVPSPASAVDEAPPAPAEPVAEPVAEGESLALLMRIVAEKTGYDVSDLEPSFELEADLGVDTVKQAEILGSIIDELGIERDETFQPAEYPTLEALAGWLDARRSGATATATTPDDEPSPARTEHAPPQASNDEHGLPHPFQLRKPVLRAAATTPAADLSEWRVAIMGEGPIAAAVRDEVVLRGGSTDEPHNAVIDLGDDVIASFHEAQRIEADRPAVWLTRTSLGALSRPATGLPTAQRDGARSGFAKSLRREWPETRAAVVDIAADTKPADVARILCDELKAKGPNEVFVADGFERSVVDLETVEPPERAGALDNPVVLLTGGGRGITARAAETIARRGPARLALIGRSPVSDEKLDEAAAKKAIKEALKAADDRVTPAKVEAQLAPMRRAEEVRQTLETLRDLGAEATYMQADLANPDDVARMLNEVAETFGPIDVVVHGAGVEESRLIADKDDAAFHRVFDGKAVGGLAILSQVPEHTYVLCMGSVAGRFGNPGQVDYAAANDALARMCHTRPRSLHVAWTAWDDVGMAVRGGMKTLLTDRGVDLLPADVGANLIADFIANGTEGELVVAGALGDFEESPEHPLLDALQTDGPSATATKALSVSNDPWIADHSIEGAAVLPGVIGVELMTATAAELTDSLAFVGARNVVFEAPAKAHKNQTTTLKVTASEDAPGAYTATLQSQRTLRTGRLQESDHFRGTVLFGAADDLDGLSSAFLPDEPIDAQGIYRRFFHGPKFQVLTSVQGVSADGLLAEAKLPALLDGLLTTPLALEAAFQAAGLHRMIVAHQMGLPRSFKELRVLRDVASDEALSILVHLNGDLYDVDIDGTEGPLLRLRGFEMIDRGPVPPDDRFEEPPEPRPVCFSSGDAGETSLPSQPVTAEARATDATTGWLSPDEAAELATRGNAKRVRDRIAGRIAAKRALHELTGVAPEHISIVRAPSGEPIAHVEGHPSVRVSISHRAGHAVAAAIAGGHVGIDLERVEHRDPSFTVSWFDDAERHVIANDHTRATIAWSIKEAVLKLIGTGMACSPHDVKVDAIHEDGTAHVRVLGSAKGHLDARTDSPVVVRWKHATDDEVVVTARAA